MEIASADWLTNGSFAVLTCSSQLPKNGCAFAAISGSCTNCRSELARDGTKNPALLQEPRGYVQDHREQAPAAESTCAAGWVVLVMGTMLLLDQFTVE